MSAITHARYRSFLESAMEKKAMREEIERLMREYLQRKAIRVFAMGEDDPWAKDKPKTKTLPQRNF